MRNLKYLLASVAIGSFMFLPLIAGPTEADLGRQRSGFGHAPIED